MVTARVLQGVGAAVAAPSILALITSMAKDEAARNRGLALFTAASAVGSSFGLILGGLLTSVASWRWALFINLPVGIAVVVTIHLLVKETPRTRGGFDVLGALFVTGGSLALVYGFIHAAESTWTSPWTVLSFVLAAALLALFTVNEHRVRHPLLKPALLKDRARSGALAVMALVVGAHFAMLFMVVQYYQHVLDFGPLTSGFAFLPLTGTVLVLTQFMPRLQARFGAPSLALTGTLLVTASFFGFAALGSGSTYGAGVLPALLVHSVGVAMVFTPTTVVIMSGLKADDAGSMSGLLQTAQQVGGSLGIAIIVAVYAAGNDTGSFTSGLAPAFYVAAAMSFAAALLALVTLTRPARRPASAPASAQVPHSDDEHHRAPVTTSERRN
ncbi:MFS transporter [Streptomyces tauricus]|uniref:MFS transporter n=1 Tax=Streptomyces tauricus TaxID=68274 RepID=UPI0033A9DE24